MMGGFEREKGTLTTVALILGRTNFFHSSLAKENLCTTWDLETDISKLVLQTAFSTFPGALYLGLEIYIFRGAARVVGSR